jgi:hypothetical protein
MLAIVVSGQYTIFMSTIEHRHNPEAFPDDLLLPSQRALLSLEAPYAEFSFSGLSQGAINQLGEFIANDLTRATDEHLTARLERNGPGAAEHRKNELWRMGVLARKLIEYDQHADPYEGMTEHQRNSCRIQESTTVKATVQEGYDPERYSGMGRLQTYDPRFGYFTPQGLVFNPSDDFKQKVVTVDIDRKSLFAEDNYFNFSSEAHLYLYTDNLSVEPPFWEYHNRDTPPDMFPSRHNEPYFFHAVPPRFIHEETAFAVVESLARVFATSSREERARQAA